MNNMKSYLFCVCCSLMFWNANAQSSVVSAAAIGMIVQEQFSAGTILITELTLEKPHIIPENLLVQLFSEYEGKEINVDDVKIIQGVLSKIYYMAGHINSGVIVPNQRIIDGKLRFRAVHGRLTRVKAAGNSRISNAYIRNVITRGVSVPLNTYEMQLALESLQRHALISDLKAKISPGKKLGQSILDISIKEAAPYFFSSELSNHQSPSIGQYRLSLSAGHRDFIGWRDTLKLEFSSSVDNDLSVGLVNGHVEYALPITVHDYWFKAYVSHAKFSIVDDAFSSADIKSESTSFGFSQSMPLLKTNYAEVSVGLGLDVKRMTLSMFGEPATLSDGFVDGESHSTPVVFHLNTLYQKTGFFIAAHAGFRRGINLNVYSNEPEGREFRIGVGQLSMAFKLLPKLEWHLRANTQLTSDSLLPAEKYAIGGAKSVRGYRENLLVRDSGIFASTQFKYALYPASLHFVPFFDYGRSWNSDQGRFGSGGEQIYSAGAGLQWRPTRGIFTELFWGKTLKDTKLSKVQTQDYSLHFLLRYSFN